MGPDGDTAFRASTPELVYDSADNEYLVVWYGDDFAPLNLIDGKFEIFGQRLDAATGDPVGANDFRVSDMGPQGDTSFGAFLPSVAYNPVDNEYLVVWQGDDDTPPLVNGEVEIFGQRLDAATGAHVGPNDFRISTMGPDESTSFSAITPDVTYNPVNHEYLVVWVGDDDGPSLVDDEFEIFGRRLDAATGEGLDEDDFRISDLGTDGFVDYSVNTSLFRDAAYSPVHNEYLVVWTGDDGEPLPGNEDYEVFGQRLADAACGNGVVETGEECDDGNTDDGDGCSAACITEADGGNGGEDEESGGGCSLVRRDVS
jgi:cysteine-rich repeat protein